MPLIKQNQFVCKICYEVLDIKKDESKVVKLECNHYFCLACLKYYFEFKINNNLWNTFKCMDCQKQIGEK